jgi:hypothetical protein
VAGLGARGAGSYPFRGLRPARAENGASPSRTLPLMQFTCPSESSRNTRYRSIGSRSLPDLFPLRGRPSRFSRAFRYHRSMTASVVILSWTWLCSRDSRTERSLSRLPLLRFIAPSASSVAGSDLHRDCLPRLCYVFRLSQPLDVLLPPQRSGLVPCR